MTTDLTFLGWVGEGRPLIVLLSPAETDEASVRHRRNLRCSP